MAKSKSTKQNHRPQAQASRAAKGATKSAEKSPPERSFPAWYYRVASIDIYGRRSLDRQDFDEDLSELEDDGDAKSERSYTGSFADHYYELKGMREERKVERLEAKRKELQDQERYLRTEVPNEEKVRAAYTSLEKAEEAGKVIPLGPAAGRTFKLYCSDHVKQFYYDSPVCYATKYIAFERSTSLVTLDSDAETSVTKKEPAPASEAAMVYGTLYIDEVANCQFGPLRFPSRASRKAVTSTGVGDYGQYELSITFIGDGYLKVSVSSELVYTNRNGQNLPVPRPKEYEFHGIIRDIHKELAERQQNRPPSPKEDWFEMNHPMGSWKMGF